MNTPIEVFLSIVLPPKATQWFDITEVESSEERIHITLTEKNNPPETHGVKPIFKSYKTMTMSDCPIRGKAVDITVRRRYWQIPGQQKLIVSDIPLVFPGTQLEKSFAEILKKRGGNNPDFLGEYSDFVPHSIKRV